MTSLLADHGINIEGQPLATAGSLGYVVTDVGAAQVEPLAGALRALPETVRLRVLS